jgi:fumarylacetoacetase
MAPSTNETHDPAMRSWVESANQPGCDFPIQNLPFGVFRAAPGGEARVGVAIGNQVLDPSAAAQRGLFSLNGDEAEAARACDAGALNRLMALGSRHWSALRRRIFHLLRHDAHAGVRERVPLLGMAEVEMLLPAQVGDYTDFYASIYHAERVGGLFRPDNPLLPNYKWLPVAYHGRASSLQTSGTPVRRPWGQLRPDPAAPLTGSVAARVGAENQPPVFAPTQRLDYEVEAGFFVGPGNNPGEPIPIGQAERHIFGMCLVNDWSARDVQSWEYQPLGPFLSKSFATTISPWVVTLEALAHYRTQALTRGPADPRLLAHLYDPWDQQYGGLKLTVEVWLNTNKMRELGIGATRLSRANMRDLYWTMAQMLTHHASNGCKLRPGDLLASGTISGPSRGPSKEKEKAKEQEEEQKQKEDARGCLLELTSGGKQPITLPGGEQRRFLEDGDEVILRGYCERPGVARIGFGECRGVVLPAT